MNKSIVTVSALIGWIAAVACAAGQAIEPTPTTTSANKPATTAAPAAAVQAPKPERVAALGPFPGHVDVNSARIWARPDKAGPVVLWVVDGEGKWSWHGDGGADPAHDQCVVWDVPGLKPATRYWFCLRSIAGEKPPAMSEGGFGFFTTAPEAGVPAKASIMFGSCIGDPLDQAQPIWTEVARQRPDAICLIGDTPYIDTTDLDKQRKKYRELFGVPELIALRRTTPMYGVWDDHDFGKNDTDGNLKGKDRSRKAFMEYHPNNPTGSGDGAGENGAGVYSRFRRGPVEVFLIDARWFSGTESSWADPSRPTLIGAQQAEWLKRELKASTAPFKLLVTGMIWNESARPNKNDYWGGYLHERAALWKWIGEQRVPGVVLIAGDIHRSRALKHSAATSGAGYPLYEFISSPMGSGVHANANVPHPALLWDAGQPRCFAIVTADSTVTPPKLTARWITDAGEELHKVEISESELRSAP